MNIAEIRITTATAMTPRGFLPLPAHSPLAAPQRLALRIPIEESIGNPITSPRFPIFQVPTP